MNVLANKLLLLLALVSCGATAMAQAMSPTIYVNIELKIRQLTNDGMAQRLFLLRLQDEDSLQHQNDLDFETRTLINAVYRGHGVTAGIHTAFGSQHAQSIASYLNENPEKAERFNIIQSEFELYSSQINAALTGQ